MTTLFRLSIHPSLSLEQAWQALEYAGIEILYGSEEEGLVELFTYLSSPAAVNFYSWIEACTPYELPAIDWKAQWEAHGLNFKNGYVHIDFTSFERQIPSLRLKPGSGFGDLSHPTTRLVLKMLTIHFRNQVVVDIGCGSGILTLFAASMGTSFAQGIDIDPEAIKHSRENAAFNNLDARCSFCLPSEFIWYPSTQPILILMNMIKSEQQVAWNSLPSLHLQAGERLTSGIRKAEREDYLTQTIQWGWFLEEEYEEEEWLAFQFSYYPR